MDPVRFDRLVLALGRSTSRRRALAILLGVRVVVGHAETIQASGSGAVIGGGGHRHRHHHHHRHHHRHHSRTVTHDHDRRCTPESQAQTCAGKCGIVNNGCKQPVDCGACPCDSTSCPTGCCQNETCHVNTDAACGTGGGACVACTPPAGCCDGACTNLQTDEANCGTCGTTCTTHQVCQAGACFPAGACPATTAEDFCAEGPRTVCSVPGAAECLCARSVENNVICILHALPGCSPTCASSADCTPGQACVVIDTCCTGNAQVCMTQCPDPDPA